jgi:hypothetical protein
MVEQASHGGKGFGAARCASAWLQCSVLSDIILWPASITMVAIRRLACLTLPLSSCFLTCQHMVLLLWRQLLQQGAALRLQVRHTSGLPGSSQINHEGSQVWG